MDSKTIKEMLINSLQDQESSIHGAELLINDISFNYEAVILSDTREVVKHIPVDVDIDYNIQVGKNLLSGKLTLWHKEYKELIGGHDELFKRIVDELLNKNKG